MRKPVNFRFREPVVLILDELSEKEGLTRTKVVEKAILTYANRKKNPLLDYAGILSEETADMMLKVSRRSRRNKTFPIR